jgi:diacylglycerol kinase (ATP)
MPFNKRLMSFVYAFRGLWLLFRTETNAQIHLAILICVVVAGGYFDLSTLEWIALLLCFGLVIGMEALNTALEKLTDLASPQIHPLAGKAKDLAAGAVLWVAIIAILVGVIIFAPKMLG